MERYVLVDSLNQHPLDLQNLSADIQDDTELVRIAVKKNGLALQYASERLRNDFETVMIAVKKSGTSLQFASNVLQSNEEIINAAVRSDGNALEFVPEPLRHNRQLILEASRNCNVKPIPEEFLSDKEIALNLVAHTCEEFAYLADVLRADIDIIMTTSENHPFSCADVMMYVPDEVVANKECMMRIVSFDGFAIEFASDELKKDKELALTAIKGAANWGYRFDSYNSDDKCFLYDSISRELHDDPDIQDAFSTYFPEEDDEDWED
jgi:hypothetical protein